MTPLERQILVWLHDHPISKDKSIEFFTNFINKTISCTDTAISDTLRNLEQRNLVDLAYYSTGEIDVVEGITEEGKRFLIREISLEMLRRR